MIKRLTIVMLVSVLCMCTSADFALSSNRGILESTEWINTLEGKLLESDQERIYDETIHHIELVASDVLNDDQYKLTLDSIEDLIDAATSRLDSKQNGYVIHAYSKVIEAYISSPNLSITDKEKITSDFIKFLGTKVMVKDNIDSEQITSFTNPIIDLHMKLQATYKVSSSVIRLEDLESLIKKSEKVYRITSSNLNQYKGLNAIGKKLERQITLKSDDNHFDVTLVSELVKELRMNKYKLVLEALDYELLISDAILNNTTGDLLLKVEQQSDLSTTQIQGRTENGLIHPTSLYDISIGGRTHKGTITFKQRILTEKKPVIASLSGEEWIKLKYLKDNDFYVCEVIQNTSVGLFEYAPLYTDIIGHWANESIVDLVSMGLVDFNMNNQFEPDLSITRGEFVKILVDIVDDGGVSKHAFSDVDANSPYFDIMGKAVHHGYTAGATAGKFYPDEFLTREDMAVMLVKMFYELKGYEMKGSFVQFKDMHDISPYAKDAICALYEDGYISGYEDNTFKPKGSVSRATAIVLLNKILED